MILSWTSNVNVCECNNWFFSISQIYICILFFLYTFFFSYATVFCLLRMVALNAATAAAAADVANLSSKLNVILCFSLHSFGNSVFLFIFLSLSTTSFLHEWLLLFFNTSDKVVGSFSTFSLFCLRWFNSLYSSSYCVRNLWFETSGEKALAHGFRSDTLS